MDSKLPQLTFKRNLSLKMLISPKAASRDNSVKDMIMTQSSQPNVISPPQTEDRNRQPKNFLKKIFSDEGVTSSKLN